MLPSVVTLSYPSRFYSNSLLATLNVRNAIRRAGESTPSYELGYVSTRGLFQVAHPAATPAAAGGVVVQIERTVGRDNKASAIAVRIGSTICVVVV